MIISCQYNILHFSKVMINEFAKFISKQECEGLGSSDSRSEMNTKLAEKLKASESLCDELMEENESLKADIKDLQQEIEEMQVSTVTNFTFSFVVVSGVNVDNAEKM